MRTAVLVIGDMHLSADTVDLGHTVGLPFLNPVHHRPYLLAGTDTVLGRDVPDSFEVIVVDEELHILGTVLAGQATSLTDVVEVAQVVLPVEIVAAYVPCGIGITAGVVGCGVLQRVVALTVIATAGDRLVHEIPAFHLTVAGFHHTLDPLVHSVNECIVHLILCSGNRLTFISLKLDVLDKDIAYEITTLKHEETTFHDSFIFNLHIFPFCCESNIRIFSIVPVTQFTVKFTIR